jgi:hypothetical protein
MGRNPRHRARSARDHGAIWPRLTASSRSRYSDPISLPIMTYMLSKLLRPICALASIAAVGGPVAGCAGSGNATGASGTVKPGASVTKARAVAYAHSVNLRATDLPDMTTASPEREGKSPRPADRALAGCDGGANPDRLVAAIDSATFKGSVEGQFEQLRSGVEVEPTVALAALNDTVVFSSRFLGCLKRFLPQSFAKDSGGSSSHYGPVTVSRLPTPLPGLDKSFGIEIATTITGPRTGGTPIHLYADELGFTSGPAEISLTAVGAPQPVSEEAEQRLVSLLYSRAQAHKL